MKKFFVTGATGFIGSYLIKKLISLNFEVYSAVRRTNKNTDNKSEIILDLNNLRNIYHIENNYKFDYIIHLGATIDISNAPSKNMYNVNVNATKLLAEMANKMKANFLFTSTAIVHGCNTRHISLDSPIINDTHYAKSKYEAELLLLSIIPSACILRLAGVYGLSSANSLGINNSIKSAVAGNLPNLNNAGDGKRNYIYVSDLVNIIIKAVKKNLKGTHLIASKHSISIKEMLRLTCEEFLPDKKFNTSLNKNKNKSKIEIEDKIVEPSFAIDKENTFKESLLQIRKEAKL